MDVGEGDGRREGTQTVGALSMPAGSLSAVTSPPALSPDRFIRTITHSHTLTNAHAHTRARPDNLNLFKLLFYKIRMIKKHQSIYLWRFQVIQFLLVF